MFGLKIVKRKYVNNLKAECVKSEEYINTIEDVNAWLKDMLQIENKKEEDFVETLKKLESENKSLKQENNKLLNKLNFKSINKLYKKINELKKINLHLNFQKKHSTNMYKCLFNELEKEIKELKFKLSDNYNLDIIEQKNEEINELKERIKQLEDTVYNIY